MRRVRFLQAAIETVRRNREFFSALVSGYGLMSLTIIVQFVLVPLYITALGKAQFGVLTIIFAAINYGAIGVGWMSGGMARVLGERAATHDRAGFAEAYAFSKIVYVSYSLVAV